MIRTREELEEIVAQLLRPELPKPERIACLRELVRSEAEIPDELLNEALRRLMARVAL